MCGALAATLCNEVRLPPAAPPPTGNTLDGSTCAHPSGFFCCCFFLMCVYNLTIYPACITAKDGSWGSASRQKDHSLGVSDSLQPLCCFCDMNPRPRGDIFLVRLQQMWRTLGGGGGGGSDLVHGHVS